MSTVWCGRTLAETTSCTWPVNRDRTNASFGCGNGDSADARCAVRGASHGQRPFVWLPLEGAGAAGQAEAPPRSDMNGVRRRRPQDEHQGEDLPIDHQGERTPLLNHPSFVTIAVAIPPASMRPLAPSCGHSCFKWPHPHVRPTISLRHCSARARRLSLKCWRPSSW